MEKKGLSQEGLKLIACMTMLIDHIGAAFVSGYGLRIVGRLAFPIYCFLLAEGVHYTRDPKKYGLRLLIGALLSEIPFDLLFFGRLTWAHSSVMVTLLLGFLYGQTAKQVRSLGHKLLLVLPFMLAAELLGTDYGGWGVALIALFILSRGRQRSRWIQIVGVALICWLIGGASVRIAGVRVPIEMFGVLALIPIFCYCGRKATGNVWVQRAFYLFYPVHLTVLLLIFMAKM